MTSFRVSRAVRLPVGRYWQRLSWKTGEWAPLECFYAIIIKKNSSCLLVASTIKPSSFRKCIEVFTREGGKHFVSSEVFGDPIHTASLHNYIRTKGLREKQKQEKELVSNFLSAMNKKCEGEITLVLISK